MIDRRACWLLVSLCAPPLALAGAPAADPGAGASAVWRWEDAEGGLHYTRWHEIPARQRKRARRVDAEIGSVGGDAAASTAAQEPEPPSATPGCARLAALRRSPPARGRVALRPGIRERFEQAHYDVDGQSPAQVRRSLDASRPFEWDGNTNWRVAWDFGNEPASPACRLRAPSVALHVTITLPRLGDRTPRDGALGKRWDAYAATLARHEDGHRDLAAAAANDVLEALTPFAGAPCSAGEAARACALSIISEYRRLQREYDLETRHGMAEGAVFP